LAFWRFGVSAIPTALLDWRFQEPAAKEVRHCCCLRGVLRAAVVLGHACPETIARVLGLQEEDGAEGNPNSQPDTQEHNDKNKPFGGGSGCSSTIKNMRERVGRCFGFGRTKVYIL